MAVLCAPYQVAGRADHLGACAASARCSNPEAGRRAGHQQRLP